MKRRRLSLAIAVWALALTSACASSADHVRDSSAEAGGSVSDGETMARAAPAFAAHFTDPLYDDPSGEAAPFGSDEGADLLATWEERRDELGPHSTVADVLEADPQDYLDSGTVDDAMVVQAAGFTLLRLTGHIDAEGKRAVLAALDQLIGSEVFRDEPLLIRQREDLRSWTA